MAQNFNYEVKEAIPIISYQGLANYGPWATFTPLPILINKALLECKHPFIYVLAITAFMLQWHN